MFNCYECEFLICVPPSLADPSGGPEFCAKNIKPGATGKCLEFQERTAPYVTVAEACDYTPQESDIPF